MTSSFVGYLPSQYEVHFFLKALVAMLDLINSTRTMQERQQHLFKDYSAVPLSIVSDLLDLIKMVVKYFARCTVYTFLLDPFVLTQMRMKKILEEYVVCF